VVDELKYQLFLTLLVTVLLALCSQILCLNRLKARHSKTWEVLGRPTIFSQQAAFFFPLLLFFYQLKFQKLRDPVLSFFAISKMFFEVVGTIVFILFFLEKFLWL
jgi:hypothetical protein